MNLLQVVKLAIAGIRANKMRSILTMLGVIIGVAAVIVLVSIGQGATKSVTEGIQGLGSNLITISIRSNRANESISYEDVMAWQDREGVAGVSPDVTGNVSLKYGNKKYDTSMEGTNAEYEQVRNTKVQAGRFILPIDLTFRQKVVLVGTTVADELFGQANPIGQTIKVNGANFKVVGLLEEKGAASFGSNDDRIIIPFTTAQVLTGGRGVRQVYVQADSPDSVTSVVAQLDNYLYRKFNNNSDAYRVNNQADMLSTVNQVTGALTMMLGGIAGISLLVGGIGIMNIMLVTVTERTREIGVRKAIGAKRGDILRQFLIEAVVVSGSGGIIGILCGFLLSTAVGSLMSMDTSVSPQIVALSFGFSVLVGILFGLYPANKAAKLNPIEALRFE